MLRSTFNLTRRNVYRRLSPQLQNGGILRISPLQLRTFGDHTTAPSPPRSPREDVSEMKADLANIAKRARLEDEAKKERAERMRKIKNKIPECLLCVVVGLYVWLGTPSRKPTIS